MLDRIAANNITPPPLFTSDEMLSYLSENGIINMNDVSEMMQDSRRISLLNKHPYRIYQGKDGRWRTYVKDESKPHGRRLIVKPIKRELELAICDFYESFSNSNMTLEELYPEWIEHKSLRVASTTIGMYHSTWKRYYQNEEITKVPMRTLSKLELDDFIHRKIRDHEMDAHKYANFMTILNQGLDYAVDKNILEKNPARDVTVDRRRVLKPELKKPDQTQVYSPKEQEAIFEIAWDYFNNKKHYVHQLVPLAVMFMFLTGLRVGEACAIRYDDVKGNILTVCRFYRGRCDEIVDHTKGTFGDRHVVLVPKAVELIETARRFQIENGLPSDGYIFSMDDNPVDHEALKKAFGRYCKQAGIPNKSSHKARKTYISTLIDGQVNINTICQQVGHRDPRTTYRSYCYDRSTSEEIYGAICDALS